MSNISTESAAVRPASNTARRYALLVLLPLLVLGLWLLLAASPTIDPMASVASADRTVSLQGTLAPLPLFLLQLLLILLATKIAGSAFRQLGQPAVIGEILAGIALGPSLFGAAFPDAQARLFPAESLHTLQLLGQLGVLVFMFAAGTEFDPGRLRGRRRQALLISHAGIATPMLLGGLLAWPLFAEFAPAGADYRLFAVFLGVALAITAFPVLLRIIDARGYRDRPIADLGVACAAISDATAWALLAGVVVAVNSKSPLQLIMQLGLALLLAWLLLVPARRRLARTELDIERRSAAKIWLIAAALLCALASELIGLHLVFGAFLAGVAVSSSKALRGLVEDRLMPFASALLLPVFFASSGLGLSLDGLHASDWLWGVVLMVAATLGKGGSTVLAARLSGIAAGDAWRLGALMNTRGLMEIVVLSLGLELGLIDQRLYALMVLVAIATTLATGPLLGAIDRRQRLAQERTLDLPASGRR